MSHSKKLNIVMTGIDDYFRNDCPRSARLNELYEHIEKLGLHEAWMQYIAKDVEDLIEIEGAEFLMKHLSVSARRKIINYIKKRY